MPSNSQGWRAHGKRYLALDPHWGAQDLIARSRTPLGAEIPAMVVPHGGTPILVVPELRVPQAVSVTLRDDPEREVARCLVSPLDIVGGNRNASHGPQPDERPSMGVPYLWLERAVRGDSKVNHLLNEGWPWPIVAILDHATRRMAYRGFAQAHLPREACDQGVPRLRLSALSTWGRPLPLTTTELGSSRRQTADGAAIATYAFSISVPERCDTFILRASLESPGTSDGFTTSSALHTHRHSADEVLLSDNTPTGPRYDQWMREHQASPLALAGQRARLAQAGCDADRPLFSLIVPLYRTPIDFFDDMASSVLEQTFPDWELVLVNASPEDATLTERLRSLRERDGRVHLITLAENAGISLNTQQGIEAARGEFLCFLDHDDFLEPDCLAEYAGAIARDNAVDLLYCDEDKWRGAWFEWGALKPDFDWAFICSNNYICHLLCCRASLVREVGGMGDPALDGAQDYDLTLRVAECARAIAHVPKVLYHWRLHADSTAARPQSKAWTLEAGERAVAAHYERTGIAATVEANPKVPNYYLTHYHASGTPLVSVIIPNKDAPELLERAIQSIYAQGPREELRLIVVENNSTDPRTLALYERLAASHRNLRVITYEGGFNFSAICNLGADAALRADGLESHVLLFLNNDTEVLEPRWLELLLGPFERPAVAACGAKLLYPDDLVQHAGVIAPGYPPIHLFQNLPRTQRGYMNLASIAPRNMLAVTGACMAVRATSFREVGGFDEGLPVNYNDIDLCLRLRRAGHEVLYVPQALLRHYESVSRGSDLRDRGRLLELYEDVGRFISRWPETIALGDPFYTPNSVPYGACYQLRWDNLPDFELG